MTETATQTYTFIFTDIEGSTQLWERFPSAMDQALEQHDLLMREAFVSEGGHIFKTVGDMFCVAYREPADAVRAAFRAQLALHRKDFGDIGKIKVRMGVYTGQARERDNDYFGTALNRVSRLMSAGHGGQILVASNTAAEVEGSLEEGVTLHSLGTHKLRDVEGTEVIFQLMHPDLTPEFPQLRTLDAIPNNLPRELSSFVGREQGIAEIKSLLRERNLVTLVGSGGCGKTRLAVQVASDLLTKFENGVWMVDLAPLADPDLVPRAFLSALNLVEEPGIPVVESLRRQLKSHTALIVLDNCEHLIDASAGVVDQIVRSAPQVKILATSREALGVPGETPWRVPSLSLPSRGVSSADDLLRRSEAARLFVERASVALPTFELNSQNYESVAAICSRLDGIPLAIELAAARVKVLPADQIAARLDDRFRLLTGGSRTALPRQQTLRALIDWSYNLLSDQEKLLLRRLAVFVGGWTLEASESICAAEPLEAWELLDLLMQLVDKSLVVYDEEDGQARYRLLETVRQYSREKLFEQEEGPELRRRHSMHYLEWVEGKLGKLASPEGPQILNQIEDDHDNFRAALEWVSAAPDDRILLLRLARALSRFWEIRGYFAEGRQWVERAIEATESESGDQRDQTDDLRMRALNQLGNICREQGDLEAAIRAFERSLELAKARGFEVGVAIVHNNMGLTWHNMMRFEEAESAFQESIAICRKLGDKINLGSALDNLGSLLRDQGRLEEARQHHDESLPIFVDAGDKRSIGINYAQRGDLEIASGNLKESEEAYHKGLELLILVDHKPGIASVLEGLAKLCLQRGKPENSAKMLGYTNRYRERNGNPIPPQSVYEVAATVEQTMTALGNEKYDQLFLEGRRLSHEAVVRLASD